MTKTGRSGSPERNSKKSKHRVEEHLGTEEQTREWEEARCPICIDHPHNAVILRCSSYDHGCHPFVCNTSVRHSNCLDKFLTYKKSSSTSVPSSFTRSSDWEITCDTTDIPSRPSISCPLCRGRISGWLVLKPARKYMNSKVRSCSCADCEFSGTYNQLRRHARRVHPTARPSDAGDQNGDVGSDYPALEYNMRHLELLSVVFGLVATESMEYANALSDLDDARVSHTSWPHNSTSREDMRRFIDRAMAIEQAPELQQHLGHAVAREFLRAASAMVEVEEDEEGDEEESHVDGPAGNSN